MLVKQQPKAVLSWADVGGVRTPLYLCDLDPAKLRRLSGVKNTYVYSDQTVDPRSRKSLPGAPGLSCARRKKPTG